MTGPWFPALRRWRLRRAEDALADAEHYYRKWVNPAKWSGTSPSEDRRHLRRLERLRERVARLSEDPNSQTGASA